MKTILHVNRHTIAHNRKNKTTAPPLIARTYKGTTYSSGFDLVDQDGRVVARFVYRPDRPLSCGAVAWIETDLEVREA